MNRSKGDQQKRPRFLKYTTWIFLFALLVPSKYTGHCASLKNVSHFVTLEHTNEEKSPLPKPTDAITPTSQLKGQRFSMAENVCSLLLIFTHVILVILGSLILGFFNSQPIVKQSLLLYLYKDFILCFIGLHCSWALARAMHYSSGNEYKMNDSMAKMISFLIYFIRFQFLLLLNIILILNLYMMKKAMINPPMPLGENEDLRLKMIRLSTIVPVFAFTTTMYIFEMYPKLYFSLQNSYDTSLVFPKGTVMFLVPPTFLLITCIILSLVTIHYKHTCQQNLDTDIPQMHNLVVFLVVALTLANLILFAVRLLIPLELFNTYSLGAILILIVIVTIPKNDQLASYVKSYLSFDILHLNIRFMCICLCIYVFVGLCVN